MIPVHGNICLFVVFKIGQLSQSSLGVSIQRLQSSVRIVDEDRKSTENA